MLPLILLLVICVSTEDIYFPPIPGTSGLMEFSPYYRPLPPVFDRRAVVPRHKTSYTILMKQRAQNGFGLPPVPPEMHESIKKLPPMPSEAVPISSTSENRDLLVKRAGRPWLPRHRSAGKLREQQEAAGRPWTPSGTDNKQVGNSNLPPVPGSSHQAVCPSPNFSPCLPDYAINQRTQQCCRQFGVSRSCAEFCKFGFRIEHLFARVSQSKCRWSEMREVLSCLSNHRDTTECCLATGVNDPLCLDVCNPTNGLPRIHTDLLRCVGSFNRVVKCYKAYHN